MACLLFAVLVLAISHNMVQEVAAAASPGSRAPSVLPSAARKFLAAHNQARAAVGVGPLKWSTQLVNAASLLARYQRNKMGCQFANLTDHKYGANQLWGSGAAVTPGMAVDTWVKEKSYYDYASNSCAPDHMCGVYKQVVWKNSSELGELIDTHPHLRNLLRQIMDLLAPLRACKKLIFYQCLPDAATLVTGTIICPIGDKKVKLCLKENKKTEEPSVFVELPLSTSEFTSSIDSSVLRIVLDPVPDSGITQRWQTYCNGQKVGFARRLVVGKEEKWVLETMQMVSSGAGFLLQKGSDAGSFKYLRGQFERIVGSDDSEAYHLVDPSYWFGQDLSVFFLQ
ncbi:hypothetical protein Goshw_018718 [Gossypium schwendimanii]|uniref:SCP domain-containing protein n=1 Tax=Gossypium schwendimanii TaxID=34291 RepID=A0A7J9LPH0_GOSSC|nr:hypothetical protein [Gossypium schwendimanii]